MTDRNFLAQLKEEAKFVQSLQKERLIPQELSGLANLVARHSWQLMAISAIIISFVWELLIYPLRN